MPQLHADTVFVGGPVFTADAARTFSDGVAVAGGRVLALGEQAARELTGARTEVVDLRGRLLVPGFVDAHAHPVFAGLELQQCDLTGAADGAACLDLIAGYAAAHPEQEWIVGGGWSMDHFADGTPTRQQLDRICAGRPVFLINRDRHGAWVNTEALRRAGVTATTPDPPRGRIEREPDGTPSGSLHEAAADLVARHTPAPTAADHDLALELGQRRMLELGVTSWQDALVGAYLHYPDTYDIYRRAEAAGTLVARVVGAQWWDPTRGVDQVEELVARRAGTGTGRFRATSVKFMQDGVCENFTAAMLAPYLGPDGGSSPGSGLSYLDPRDLAAGVSAVDHQGFQAHFHTIGDRAVREALDAVERARATRPAALPAGHRGDNRHHLAHIQVIHPDDIPRFRALRAAANMQPLWAHIDPQMSDLTAPFLGPERTERQYPFQQLRASGATLVAGSDWPVSSADPMLGIHVAVNRMAPGGAEGAPLTPHQRLTLVDALAAYTAGSSWINHLEHTIGSIAPGRDADLVVLDRDPFQGGHDEISLATVDETFVAGRRVHAREYA